MSSKTVELIAAEDEETRRRRIELKDRKKAIEESRALCENVIPHEDLQSVSPPVPPARYGQKRY
jgi:hypothetical protein